MRAGRLIAQITVGLLVGQAGAAVLPSRLINQAVAKKPDKSVELDIDKVAPLASEKEKQRTLSDPKGDFLPEPPSEHARADMTEWFNPTPADKAPVPTTTVSMLASVEPREQGSGPKRGVAHNADGTVKKDKGNDGATEARPSYTRSGAKEKQGRVGVLVDGTEESFSNDGKGTAKAERQPGFDKEKSKEAKRDAAAVTYDNADGSKTAIIHGGQVNVKDAEGRFVAVDTELTQTDGRIRPKRALVDVSLAGAANDPGLVTITDQGTTFDMAMVGAVESPASISGDTATYVGAADGIDLVHQVLPGGLKETVVINAIGPALGEDPSSARVSFSLSGAALQATEDGSIKVLDAGGKSIGVIPAPSATTADGQPIDGAKVAYELGTDPATGVSVLALVIDRAWLGAQSLPLHIDPSYFSGVFSLDTMAQAGSMADTNFSTFGALRTGYWCGLAHANGLIGFQRGQRWQVGPSWAGRRRAAREAGSGGTCGTRSRCA